MQSSQSKDKYKGCKDGDEVDEKERIRHKQMETTSQAMVLRFTPWMMIIMILIEMMMIMMMEMIMMVVIMIMMETIMLVMIMVVLIMSMMEMEMR